jgi:hypothetical protein
MEYFLDFRQTRPRKQVPLRQQKNKSHQSGRAPNQLLSGKRSGAYGVALPRISIS